MRRLRPCLLLLVFLFFAACGDRPAPAPPTPTEPFIEVSRPLMGTQARVVLYSRDPKAAFDAAQAALDEAERLEKVLSDYDPASELMRLCAAGHTDPVPVSKDLYDALSLALDLARRTGGMFDPTIGAYTHLWRTAREKGEVPSAGARAEAASRVGWEKIELHPPTRRVRLTVPGMQLDLGGFGKGYAAQAAWAVLGMKGFPSCLVDIGGDIVVGKAPEGKAGWTVALAGGGSLLVADCAVAASGDSVRHVEIDGVRHGHILDPTTGLAVTTGARSVVVGRDAVSADVFATVLCIVPPAVGIAQAEGTVGVEARVAHGEGPAVSTSGFAALLQTD